jgi:hypothetical protein
MPCLEEWEKIEWKNFFTVRYLHVPPEPKFMSPKTMDITDHYKTFYLSPFKFVTFGRSIGKDYIFADSMYTE